jgi:hypothetical protein
MKKTIIKKTMKKKRLKLIWVNPLTPQPWAYEWDNPTKKEKQKKSMKTNIKWNIEWWDLK